jgi:hypothetical protein
MSAGRHEESIVETIACLIRCKQNLKIYRVAEKARSRYSQIRAELAPKSDFPTLGDLRDPEDIRKAEKIADRKARKELGAAWKLVASSELLTMEHLMDELAVLEHLNAMISRCLKQLLFVRGLKSLPSPAAAPRQMTQIPWSRSSRR